MTTSMRLGRGEGFDRGEVDDEGGDWGVSGITGSGIVVGGGESGAGEASLEGLVDGGGGAPPTRWLQMLW